MTESQARPWGSRAPERLAAATPNFTFAEDANAGNVYNLHKPELKTAKGSFFLQISEWVAWHRS